MSDRTILNAGDTAFVVEFGARIDSGLVAEVNALDRHLAGLKQAGKLPGMLETVPTFRSLAVIFDPLVTTPADILAAADAEPVSDRAAAGDAACSWSLPVAYGGDGGPDLEEVAERTSLSCDAVIEQHQATPYQAYMLGFQPGFAFLGDLDHSLRLPRRDQPRVRVPAGSVAIANQLTAVYPWESPGGWHLIGYCPIPLFNASWDSPTLMRAGDRIRFRAIDRDELHAIGEQLAAGTFDFDGLQGA